MNGIISISCATTHNLRIIIMRESILRIVLVTAAILLIPLVAMQFTDQVVWTLSDFVMAGVLLLGTGLLRELIVRKVTKTSHRIILVGALFAALLLVWADLAVGIFDIPGFSGS